METITLGDLKGTEHCSHAALIILFLSEQMERMHSDASREINAVYPACLLRPVTYTDQCNYPSLGANAYNETSVNRCVLNIV